MDGKLKSLRAATFKLVSDAAGMLGLEEDREEGIQGFLREREEAAARARRRFADHPSRAVATIAGIFSPDSLLRHACARALLGPEIRFVEMAAIAFNCVVLALDTPGSAYNGPMAFDPGWDYTLCILNTVVAGYFTLDFLARVVAFGFYGNEGAFVRDPWNVLNLLLLALQIASVGMWWAFGKSTTAVKIVKAFASLRAIVAVRNVPTLEMVFRSMLTSLAPVLSVMLFVLVLYLVFSILSVFIYRGCFWYCAVSNPHQIQQPRNLTLGICYPYPNVDPLGAVTCETTPSLKCPSSLWRKPDYSQTAYAEGVPFSFDDVLSAFLLLFEISSTEGYSLPLHTAVDSVHIGANPLRDYSVGQAFYFIFLIFLFNILLLSLFVGVIVSAFTKLYDRTAARTFLTPREYEWVQLQRKAIAMPYRAKYVAPPQQPRRTVHDVVTSLVFKRCVLALIAANTVVLCSLHFGASDEFMRFYWTWDYLLGSLYAAECAMKIYAFGPKEYFARPMNVLDIVVVLSQFVGWIVPQAREPVQVIDILRVGHFVFLFRSVMPLMSTLLLSLPMLANVSVILFLIFYVYTIFGIAFFSELRRGSPPNRFGYVNRYANFESFGYGIVTLFRMSTGEAWNGLMRDFALISSVSYPYFVSFTFIIQFTLINLTIAVLMYDLQNETVDRQRGESSKVSVGTLNDYAVVWADVRLDYEIKQRVLVEASKRRRRTLAHKYHSEYHHDAFPTFAFFSSRSLAERKHADGTTTTTEEEEEEEDVKRPGPCSRLFSYLSLEAFDTTRNSDLAHPQMRLPVSELPTLLLRLPSPLGLKSFANWVTKPELLRIVSVLQIPVSEDGFIYYHLTLRTLIDRVVLDNALNITMQEMFGERNFLDIKAEAVDIPLSLEQRATTTRVSEELWKVLKLRLPEAKKKRLERQSVRIDPANANAAVKLAKDLLRGAIGNYVERRRAEKKEAGARGEEGKGV